jgi:hypothetical protein
VLVGFCIIPRLSIPKGSCSLKRSTRWAVALFGPPAGQWEAAVSNALQAGACEALLNLCIGENTVMGSKIRNALHCWERNGRDKAVSSAQTVGCRPLKPGQSSRLCMLCQTRSNDNQQTSLSSVRGTSLCCFRIGRSVADVITLSDVVCTNTTISNSVGRRKPEHDICTFVGCRRNRTDRQVILSDVVGWALDLATQHHPRPGWQRQDFIFASCFCRRLNPWSLASRRLICGRYLDPAPVNTFAPAPLHLRPQPPHSVHVRPKTELSHVASFS